MLFLGTGDRFVPVGLVGAALILAVALALGEPQIQPALSQACPPGGTAPGVLHVVFKPGTPPSEQTAGHAAAGATLGERSEEQIPNADGSTSVTVTVAPGREGEALQIYRSRPSVQSAMPVVISPPVCPAPAQDERLSLPTGCSNVALTWPDGTQVATVAAAVEPASALIAVWRLDASTGRFLGWSPLPKAPNDIDTVDRLDAVFLCLRESGTLVRPAL